MGRYLIDTSILIDHLRDYHLIDEFVMEAKERYDRLLISVLSRAEIYAGASISDNQELKRASDLLSLFEFIAVDSTIADRGGDIKRRYKIHIIDSLIAATALVTDSVLLTRNTKDFAHIPNLKTQTL